jgi:hypothetical protein
MKKDETQKQYDPEIAGLIGALSWFIPGVILGEIFVPSWGFPIGASLAICGMFLGNYLTKRSNARNLKHG